MLIWRTIARMLEEHGAVALVTLAEAAGSSPREPGARMVVAPDGRFAGTIGGGALEWGALAEAQALLGTPIGPSVRRLDKALGPDLGQCCGGRVTLLLERFDRDDQATAARLADAESAGELVTVATVDAQGRLRRRVAPTGEGLPTGESYRRLEDGRIAERFADGRTPLYLFGAGHVGRALAAALAALPFRVTWIDPRAGAFPDRADCDFRCITDENPVRFIADAPAGAFIAVMTHSHALDLDLIIAALSESGGEGTPRFPYVGLIGSETKRARFVAAMRKMGLPSERIDRLVCPIGLPDIRDKAPAAIAVAIAAQLLIVREAVAGAAEGSTRTPDLGARDARRGGRHG